VQAVEAKEANVLKFMGDGILSIFPIGTQQLRSDQCRNAIDAARAALAAMAELNNQRQEVGEEYLSMGIGINRGSVTYGNIGSPDRFDFTV
jgi:adenylate cyclase